MVSVSYVTVVPKDAKSSQGFERHRSLALRRRCPKPTAPDARATCAPAGSEQATCDLEDGVPRG